MHDKPTALYSAVISCYFNVNYPQQWTARKRDVLWPPGSLYINPVYYYMRGYLKGYVYCQRNFRTRQNLWQQVIHHTDSIRAARNTANKVQQSATRRAEFIFCVQ